ncbi:hypothetical protein ES708_22362 [subsurface metagenome]
MGLDPTDPVFEPGAQCGNCKDVIFGGITPKYIELRMHDVVQCAGPTAPPNGVILMTQQGGSPCIYNGNIGVSFFTIIFKAATTEVFVLIIIGAVFYYWFRNLNALVCSDLVANTNVCPGAQIIGEGGHVHLYWGPTIGT